MQIWELKGLSITPTLLPNPYTMGFVVVVVVVVVVVIVLFFTLSTLNKFNDNGRRNTKHTTTCRPEAFLPHCNSEGNTFYLFTSSSLLFFRCSYLSSISRMSLTMSSFRSPWRPSFCMRSFPASETSFTSGSREITSL